MTRKTRNDLQVPVWTGSQRDVGDTTYRLYSDGSYRRWPPKLKGKAARKADKRARRHRPVRVLELA